MSYRHTTGSTDFYFTFTTTSTASTDLTFTIVKPRSPKKMPPEDPDPAPLRGGEKVRVTAEGILQGKIGTVTGFMEAGGKRLAFVSWPTGGWTTFAEGDLQPARKK